jgi:hypothetical protein
VTTCLVALSASTRTGHLRSIISGKDLPEAPANENSRSDDNQAHYNLLPHFNFLGSSSSLASPA